MQYDPFLNFKNETLDITGGYFYEQFGNGLILRSWEDRQLGINTAIRGVRIKFDPLQDLSLTALFGQQRNGFEVSDGTISGLDANFDIGSAAELGSVDLRIGASYVSRYQDRGTNEEIPSTVAAYGGRLDWGVGNFYGGFEGIVKDSDVIANEGVLVSNRLYDGTALQVNLGYSQKGFGINSTFRRLENFSFYADRLAEGNQFNIYINSIPVLATTFYDDFSYDVEFIGKGNNYFRDINFEIKNRWSSSFSSVLTYQNVMADKGVVLGGPLGGPDDIEANVVVAEGTVKFEGSKSLRVAGQHLWTQQDRKNWAGGVAEYNFNSHFSLYVADAWNYGGEGELHYYNFGGSYTKGRTRLGMNYGRQRGGLICVGGVCRFVPENNGFSANLSVNF